MPLIQAHRGASGYAPENTLPAFRRAVELNADGIETDIYLTADGHLAVCHDPDISRTSNGSGVITEMTMESLRRFDFGSWYSPEFAGTVIPSLPEVLELVRHMDVINIEIKDMGPAGSAARREAFALLLRQLKEAGCVERTLISSFHHSLLKELKEASPALRTGLLYGDPFTPEETIAMVRSFDADAIHPYIGCLTESVAEACRKRRIDINAWTINDPENVRRALSLGVTGIITNLPDMVRQVMEG